MLKIERILFGTSNPSWVSLRLCILRSIDDHECPTSMFTDTYFSGGTNDVGCYGYHSIIAGPGSLRHLLMSAGSTVKIDTVKLNLWEDCCVIQCIYVCVCVCVCVYTRLTESLYIFRKKWLAPSVFLVFFAFSQSGLCRLLLSLSLMCTSVLRCTHNPFTDIK